MVSVPVCNVVNSQTGFLPGWNVSIEKMVIFNQFSQGSLQTWDLFGVNYCVDYSLNNGLCYTKWAHSHLLFVKLLHGLNISIMGFVPTFCDCVD